MENLENQNPENMNSEKTESAQIKNPIPNMQPIPEKIRSENRMMTKGVIIFVLIILSLIIIPYIDNLISERTNNQQIVTEEITSKWGKNQTIYGPFIAVKYDTKTGIQTKYISANNINIKGDIKTTEKKRSIYKSLLYKTDLNVNAQFGNLTEILAQQGIVPASVKNVSVVLAFTDQKGLNDNVVLASKGQKIQFENNGQPFKLITKVDGEETINSVPLITANITNTNLDLSSMDINLKLNGSSTLSFTPSAKSSTISLKNDWKDIKYNGNYLPEENMDQGIATWKVLGTSSSLISSFVNPQNFDAFSFGLNFLQMNDNYDKTERCTKYAILFIGLTFICFFFIELIQKVNIHIIQYALVAGALCIFFILLLSISEYLGFATAYIIASSAVILLICSFLNSFIINKKTLIGISTILVGLYTYIYFIIQLKEGALLVGSIGLFVILAILMQFSKKINFKTEIK